jgi:peptide/nickel transport system permease protein
MLLGIDRSYIYYLLKRICSYILVMLASISFSFILFRLVPINPVDSYLAELKALAQVGGLPEEISESLYKYYMEKFGLSGDIFTQYISFLRMVIINRSFGPSLMAYPKPAEALVVERLPWTIGLLSVSILMSWIIGTLLGVLAGWRRDSKIDRIISISAFIFAQIPFYMVGILLIFIFHYWLNLLPLGGAFSAQISTLSLDLNTIRSILEHSILPAITLVTTNFFGWLISMRSIVITILGEDYLLFAESKGLKKMRIFSRYVLRNALLPQITGLSMAMGFIMGGSVIVERIFMYPGIGNLFATAIGRMDYPVINACLTLIIVSVLTSNLIVDLILPLIDPRVKS